MKKSRSVEPSVSISTLKCLAMLNEYEIEYLLNMETIEWGSWVGAVIESLQVRHLMTRGANISLTEKGLRVQKALELLSS